MGTDVLVTLVNLANATVSYCRSRFKIGPRPHTNYPTGSRGLERIKDADSTSGLIATGATH